MRGIPVPSAARRSSPFRTLKRTADGIWSRRACEKTIIGGAWTVSITAAATVHRQAEASVFLELEL
jgi:ribosomal protein L37AE/L43A